MCLQDGYKLIPATQLLSGIAALNRREISFRAFRVYFGCLELQSVREAARRSSPQRAKKSFARYREEELERLIGFKSVGKELRRLRRAGLVRFTENAIEIASSSGPANELLPRLGSRGGKRFVPIPRRVLRFLAKCSRPALAKSIVAYCLRGLSLERSGIVRGVGTAKISWISTLCQISERAARAARAELIAIGWITKDTGSVQRKLNRDGAYFTIDTSWRRASREIAPLREKSEAVFAPPPRRPETPSDLKNQKLAKCDPSGFRGTKFPEGEGRQVAISGSGSQNRPAVQGKMRRGESSIRNSAGTRPAPPRLSNVVPEDLRDSSRLQSLLSQAIRCGRISSGENQRLQFFAAAEHSRSVGSRNPCGLFSAIVGRGLWHVIAHQDEERARERLRNLRENRESGRGEKQPDHGKENASVTFQSLFSDIVARMAIPAQITKKSGCDSW